MTSRDSTTHLLTYLLKGLKVRFPRALPLMPPSFEFPNTRSKRLAGRGTTPGDPGSSEAEAATHRMLWPTRGARRSSSFLLSAFPSFGQPRGKRTSSPPSSALCPALCPLYTSCGLRSFPPSQPLTPVDTCSAEARSRRIIVRPLIIALISLRLSSVCVCVRCGSPLWR